MEKTGKNIFLLKGLEKRNQEIKEKLNIFCKKKNLEHISLNSQLIRPLISYEIAKLYALDDEKESFLYGVLAIQTIHEASLFHDDIIDKGEVRRGKAITLNHEILAQKLMQGDFLIAQSFDFISKTGSIDLIKYYSQCNLNVIKGELYQNKKRGQTLNWEDCCNINKLKTGSLFASAAAVPIFLAENLTEKKEKKTLDDFFEVICEIGMVYQMLDDLLDYEPNTETGKAPLKDFQQQKFTFLMLFCKEIDWSDKKNLSLERLTDYLNKKASLQEAIKMFHLQATKTKIKLEKFIGKENLIFELIQSWQNKLDHCTETTK